MTNSDIDALPWHDASTPAPEGQPVLAEFHAWNDPKLAVMQHVVWWFKGQWCSYPSTEDVAYVDRWQPLPESADMIATILALRDQLAKADRALRDVFEEWAGSEGLIPETAPEGYLLQLTKRMADIAAAGIGATYAELAK